MAGIFSHKGSLAFQYINLLWKLWLIIVLCHNSDPTEVTLDPKKLRPHLIECLRSQGMTMFAILRKHIKRSISTRMQKLVPTVHAESHTQKQRRLLVTCAVNGFTKNVKSSMKLFSYKRKVYGAATTASKLINIKRNGSTS